MITFTTHPIKFNTILGDCYLIYVESGGQHENDIWTGCLCETGEVKHFTTKQVTIERNQTFNINNTKKDT